MSNKRILKAYERFDYNGKIVPGSLVLRDRIPKNGKWKEVQTYQCCNQDPNCIVFTIEATEGNLDFWFRIGTINDLGPNVTGTITWGDGVVDAFSIPAEDDSRVLVNHTFPNPGSFSGTICVDTPSRITQIEANIND